MVRHGRLTTDPRVLARRVRRYTSARKWFVERNHDITKTLLLVGSGRSGSTWLSEVLVEAFSCRLIFEPLRSDVVALSRNMRWGSYADADSDDAEFHRVLERVLTGRIRNPIVDAFNAYRLPNRRLVKEIRATNLLPWIHAHFPEVPVIYLLRHPVAASWSATELGWKPYISEFLRQPRLMDGPLAPYRDVVVRHGDDPDLFHRHVLRWCLENSVPISQLEPGSVHVVFYENLVQDPYGELGRLAAYLGHFGGDRWTFDPTAPTTDRLSRANYRKTPALSARERLESWAAAVPQLSIERALALWRSSGSIASTGHRRCRVCQPTESCRAPGRSMSSRVTRGDRRTRNRRIPGRSRHRRTGGERRPRPGPRVVGPARCWSCADSGDVRDGDERF